MNRHETLLSLFSQEGLGLEVGPSYNPLLPKSAGYNIETVDYADAASLRDKYRSDSSVDVGKIEDVTYVSDGRSLLDLIGHPARYDYIVALHVIEHVTDIVRFLRDCETLLKPDGVLVLAVPDKRFCFDALRPVSTVGQALQAYAEARKRHHPGMLFDHISTIIEKAGRPTWPEADFDDLTLQNDPLMARNMFETARHSDEYHDIHAWQFTPSYFKYMIQTLRYLGYIQSGILSFKANEMGDTFKFEFYVTLSKGAPLDAASGLSLLKSSEDELREIRMSAELAARESSIVEQISHLNIEIAAVRNALSAALRENEALRASSSWKITAPLRYLKALPQTISSAGRLKKQQAM